MSSDHPSRIPGSRPSGPSIAARLAAGATLAALAIGCGSQPQVAEDVPPVEPVTKEYQPGEARPRGMPEDPSLPVQIDPESGRPQG